MEVVALLALVVDGMAEGQALPARAVARWAEWPLYDATSLPDATVHGLVLTDTRVRSAP